MGLVVLAGLDGDTAGVFRRYRGALASRCVVVHDEESLHTYFADAVVDAVVLGPGMGHREETADWMVGRSPELLVLLLGPDTVDVGGRYPSLLDPNQLFGVLEQRLTR